MKCPFLVKKTDVFNEEGKKIGEDIEIQECIKNECMVYDGAAKMCSLLSSDVKAGVLIDEVKNCTGDIKKEMNQRTEAIGGVISSSLQTLQEALLDRFEILRKQNEVMVLGFDRLSEVFTNKLGETNATLNDFNEKIVSNFDTFKETLNNQGDDIKSIIKSLQDTVVEIKNTNVQVSEDTKNLNEKIFNKLTEYIEKSESIYSKIDFLNSSLEKLTTINQSGMEIVGREIEKAATASQEILGKIDTVDNLVDSINSVTEVVKGEIYGLKSEVLNSLNSVSGKFDEASKVFSETILGDFRNEIGKYIDVMKNEIGDLGIAQVTALDKIQTSVVNFEDLFKSSSENIAAMSTMMGDLNKNYLESLGKIAGLAEGMRTGVEKVGGGVHDSMKDLITEMKKEFNLIEKQYEKTYGNIAKVADRFEDLNNRIKEMTEEVQKEFKGSFDRQAKLSDYTKGILENIKGYFEKEDARYKEEQLIRHKKEGIDHFDRSTLYYYRGNYELALNEINKALEIDKTAEYFNLKGLLLVELGQFDESQKVYTEALKLEPNLAEIHNNLGLLYLRMKKLDDAVVSFQAALKKNVNYALAYVNLGKALIDLERFDDAIKAYSRALEIDPTNQEASEAIKLYKEGKIGE